MGPSRDRLERKGLGDGAALEDGGVASSMRFIKSEHAKGWAGRKAGLR